MLEIESYISEDDKLSRFSTELHHDGHNNQTYILTNNTIKYVAHVNKNDAIDSGLLLNSFRIYKYFEEKEINFVPKVVSYKEDSNILIETHVGEKDINIIKLEDKLLDLVVKNLVKIHSIDYENFLKFCRVNNFDVPPVVSPTANLKQFGVERFEKAKMLCPSQEIIDWIKPKLEENINFVKEITHSNKPHIMWGDIGDNIRTDGKKIWFIDFEYSKIGYDNELAYLKIHSHPTDKQFNHIVNKYSEYSKIDKDDLLKEIKSNESVIRINDVIWASMKWGESRDDSKLSGKYKKLTYDRIKLYKETV